MNSQNVFGSNSNSQTAGDAEATLRLIAGLKAPQGLEERVITGLRSAPPSGRVLGWPSLLNRNESWLRSAAAAAIVTIVVGGGWGIYKRIQPDTAVVAQPRVTPAAGFSNAGAVRVPQTLPTPEVAQPALAEPVQPVPVVKTSDKPAQTAQRRGAHKNARRDVTTKPVLRPSVTVAR
jgi:hypothetical protein